MDAIEILAQLEESLTNLDERIGDAAVKISAVAGGKELWKFVNDVESARLETASIYKDIHIAIKETRAVGMQHIFC